MRHLPLFHDLHGTACVVVGRGENAARKIRLLQSAGATLVVFAQDCTPAVAASVAEAGGQWHDLPQDAHCLLENETLHDAIASAGLVIAASQDLALDTMVSALARVHHVPVNVVDQPALSTCLFPSILSRGSITVAVSSGGDAPVLARLLRARLETLLPASLGTLADLAAAARDPVRAVLPDVTQRRQFWDSLLQDGLFMNDHSSLPDTVDALLAHARAFHATRAGACYWLVLHSLDPDELRLRDLRHLQSADVLLHTPAVPRAVLSLARRDAHVHSCSAPGLQDAVHSHVTGGAQVVVVCLAGEEGTHASL